MRRERDARRYAATACGRYAFAVARLGMYDCALARSESCGACSTPGCTSGSRCAGNPPGTSGPGVPTGVRVTCPPRTSVAFSAHSLAGVCGSAPDEMVGTKLGGEGWIVVILDYFHSIRGLFRFISRVESKR
jgi:hypothetical protein